MALQGINVNGTLYMYDYNYLENKPTIPESGDALPEVTSADEGKILRVDANGEWAASSSGASGGLPAVTVSDAGKILQVNASGEWAAASVPNAEEATF